MTLRLFFATCATSRTINAQQSTLLSCHESGGFNHKLCNLTYRGFNHKLCNLTYIFSKNLSNFNFLLWKSNAIRLRNAYTFSRKVHSLKLYLPPKYNWNCLTSLTTTAWRQRPEDDGLTTTAWRRWPDDDGLTTTAWRRRPDDDGLTTTAWRMVTQHRQSD